MGNTVEQALITPRYLAGGGDPGWITVPLHRAAGWSYGHDPLMLRALTTSPDQLIPLRLDPDPDDPGWWTIRHARTANHPGWTATFEARTPVEIIAAFTDALTDREYRDRGHSGPADLAGRVHERHPAAPDRRRDAVARRPHPPIHRDPSRIPGLARDRMTVHTHHLPAPDIAVALERRVSTLARPALPSDHCPSPRRTL
ncbi:DUF317 domain-containing protein [Streptomyces bobili]